MKQKILQKIEELWDKYPDQRFFQLLFNYSILGTRAEPGKIQDPFYYDDRDVYNSMKEALGQPTEVWTTADGEEIEYKDLTDSHLQNILIDGYRAELILKEAERRKWKIPPDATIQDYMMLLEASASCAIEGNKVGESILKSDKKGDSAVWVYANRAKNKNFYEKS